ncbi:hypothetical protein [Lewinella sp. 4G2]|uniref:hypothetical protein n=1 Tax=Lewinella sp. 4G2 TaxID=1803372 RepID=UPI0007B49E12|nr:hypothetical protein [Lewinella sp. 4G2]OAV44259.1 hypothetical protein A3850_007015 [Lewinella sp. 4G2]
MPQLSWSINGVNGIIYRIGLFHGDKDRHVVVHCNDKVVAVDFSVEEAKTYSVFLDQELCEVAIETAGPDQYTYDCRINRDAATPLNEKRKQHRAEEEKRDQYRVIGLLSIGIIILLIWLLY